MYIRHVIISHKLHVIIQLHSAITTHQSCLVCFTYLDLCSNRPVHHEGSQFINIIVLFCFVEYCHSVVQRLARQYSNAKACKGVEDSVMELGSTTVWNCVVSVLIRVFPVFGFTIVGNISCTMQFYNHNGVRPYNLLLIIFESLLILAHTQTLPIKHRVR